MKRNGTWMTLDETLRQRIALPTQVDPMRLSEDFVDLEMLAKALHLPNMPEDDDLVEPKTPDARGRAVESEHGVDADEGRAGDVC